MTVAPPAQPTWKRHEGRLCLVANGVFLWPSSFDVYASVFEGQSELCGLRSVPNAAMALPGLRFSQFPADLALRINGAAPGPARLELGVRIRTVFSAIGAADDQLIAEDVWYPISKDEIQAALSWLKDRGIQLSDDLSLRQLIAMRLAAEMPADLVDNYKVGESPSLTVSRSAEGVVDAKLYPYQEVGAAFLRYVAEQDLGCILADEMGLGKTLQVIVLMATESLHNRRPNLVVCPATLVENWRRELARFAPQLRVLVHAGSGRPGTARGFEEFDVLVTTYDTALRDQVILESIQWNVLAADEAQAIKNPDAQRTTALKSLPRRVSIAVTGTPVENRLQDLWSICDFAMPGLLGDRSAFASRFADHASDAAKLGERVSPVVLRRRVSEVAADLPERIEIPQPVSVGSEFCELYEIVRQEALTEYGVGGGMVAINKLRMLCAHPSLVAQRGADVAANAPKLTRLLEILEEIFSDHAKVLIFTTFQKMTDLLVETLRARWPNTYFDYIDGRVAVENRQPAVDAFSRSHGSGALMLNPKAAGTGLNITAANHVIHYNPEWNPAVTDQASARSYRKGQTLPVTIHHLFLADTIEESIMDRSRFKRELSEEAVRDSEDMPEALLIRHALEMSPSSTREGGSK